MNGGKEWAPSECIVTRELLQELRSPVTTHLFLRR